MFLLSAITIGLLTLLDQAGEDEDLEKILKANTSKTHTYSLFRQGCKYYKLSLGIREEWAKPLMDNFNRYLERHRIPVTIQDAVFRASSALIILGALV